jgi:hypothetical protein
VLKDVKALVEWCKLHNSNKLVTNAYDPSICDDQKRHPAMQVVLRYMQDVAETPKATVFAQACAVMDEAFPERWRRRKYGGFIIDGVSKSETQVSHVHNLRYDDISAKKRTAPSPSETPLQGQGSSDVMEKGGMHEGNLQGSEKKVGIHQIHSTSVAFDPPHSAASKRATARLSSCGRGWASRGCERQ